MNIVRNPAYSDPRSSPPRLTVKNTLFIACEIIPSMVRFTKKHFVQASKGFTLAELLISLLILGVIATFTIPKILQAQQSQQKSAVTKEAISSVSGAYNIYKLQNTVTAATGMDDLIADLNYVREETAMTVDHKPGVASADCSTATVKCYRLHNGAILWYSTVSGHFTGTTNNDYLLFLIDPDGEYSNGDANGKAVELFLYTTGRLTSRAIVANDPTRDPVWFSW